ncbi:3-hydroxyacyl-CoA dehydrogenase family protein [Streptomyces sp. TRM43335]|uniref:3-hydroxyacyl-CoA dehydrogenase family protein n=1 Tax=Streptomyces taklimakanensis TaxID=2569853 RepID=A0A6G2BBB3_9ACTN|nr:3-hydroxyacyl-CoA dehydrogenase family protein [Streptomyces taklimakanensis]MTE19557.1 3-hydroxyacyl-CoA dehydrogenase family protein [Streptomyces taklimakanensis]
MPVGVVGAGTMGTGVAQCFAAAGHPVVVVDPDPAARAAGPERLRAGVRAVRLLRRRAVGPVEERVTWAEGLSALSGARFVVECVPERVPLKEAVLGELDRVCPPETVFASCTSAIPIGRLGSFTGRPERVVGTHFMNPAPLKDTVEVVGSPHTGAHALALTVDLLAGLGKEAIVVGDGPGFVGNRVLMLTVNEAAAVVDEGTADADTVDRVFQDCFGHATGPLRTADLIGLDTVLDTLDVLREHTGDERFRPTPLLARLVAEGNLGRKSGRGFHPYPSHRATDRSRHAGVGSHV